MRKLSLILIILIPMFCTAQPAMYTASARKGLIELSVKKWGAYVGLQRGKYTVPEFGGEYLWKKIRLKKPIIHAAHAGFNYNFKHNVLGYDMGYWFKPHRIGLTYGANIFYRTDFTSDRLGIAPVIGFKFWFAHLQTGFHFMNRPSDFATNTFFVSLRLSIINERDFDLDWNAKNKK